MRTLVFNRLEPLREEEPALFREHFNQAAFDDEFFFCHYTKLFGQS